MAQLGRVTDNLEYCSVPCHGFDFWSRILSAEHKKKTVTEIWVIEFVSSFYP